MAQKIKSKFIKDKIKKLKFTSENRKYINDLKYIEHGILVDGCLGWAGGIMFDNLIDKYQKEYLAILKELRPKEQKKELKRIEKEKKEDEELERWDEEEEKRELEAEKKIWREAGGVA